MSSVKKNILFGRHRHVLEFTSCYPHIQVLIKTQKKDRIGKDEAVDVFGTNNFFYKKITARQLRNSPLHHTNPPLKLKMVKLTLGKCLMKT